MGWQVNDLVGACPSRPANQWLNVLARTFKRCEKKFIFQFFFAKCLNYEGKKALCTPPPWLNHSPLLGIQISGVTKSKVQQTP